MFNKLITIAVLSFATIGSANAAINQTKGDFEDKFRQLDESLPTPNVYRNAAGEPGHEYWQQQVDYKIKAKLDEEKRRIDASQVITYHNNSPDTLKYLWMQLDQNKFRNDSMSAMTTTFGGIGNRGPATSAASSSKPAQLSLGALRRQQFTEDNVLGYDIQSVKAKNGKALKFTIVGTNMRIDLPTYLKPGKKVEFSIDYAFNIVEEDAVSARSGYEHFADDKRKGGNDIFLLAQWFPRLHAYTDYEAWTNKEFIGRGEFTLEFGNYDLELTVPADHIVSSTGALQNPKDVLTSTQRKRLKEAEKADRTVFVVTEEEALENEKEGTNKTKTWKFSAENVRDVAWASSRKFMWDARGYQQGGNDQPLVMAMSFYPKEGGDLWKKYSTEAVIQTLEVYSRFSFDYPYPVAQSVNGPVGGMEYPMITFNGPRTELQDDGSRTYSQAEKRFLIGVVIHEVGHIYFPMVVNSDERQWTWMDEGLNTFLQFLAEQAWEEGYPSRRGHAAKITNYMKSDNQVPIMTNSESILQFGNNAYGKPATALNILRETIMGREIFDFAFKEYAQRWKFKRPTPADFFRTMEDASAVDLDWFFRGWFYTTDHVDIALGNIHLYTADSQNPDTEEAWQRALDNEKPEYITDILNKGQWLRTQDKPELLDFYNEHDQFTATNAARNKYNSSNKKLEQWEKDLLLNQSNFYIIDFENKGGLVMPIILDITYADGSTELMKLPAEIWRKNNNKTSKLLIRDKEITALAVDAKWETADVDVNNNYWPARPIKSRFELYKDKKKDMMRDYNKKLKSDDEEEMENTDS
jgi:hypothetical protein